jgi:hypothetical protein
MCACWMPVLQGQGGAPANVKINSGLLPEFHVHTDSVEFEGGHGEAGAVTCDVRGSVGSVYVLHTRPLVQG